MAILQQLGVQLGQITGLRHRYPVVAPEVAHFAFHAALFVAFARSAETGLVLPMGTKGDEARRQLPLIAAQNLLHRARQVVVAQLAKDPTKIMESQFVRF